MMKNENRRNGTQTSSKGTTVSPALEWFFSNMNGELTIALHYPALDLTALISRHSNGSNFDGAWLVNNYLYPSKKPTEMACGLAHAILALTPYDLVGYAPFQVPELSRVAVPCQRPMVRLPTAITTALDADYQGNVRAFSVVSQSGLHAISVHYANWPEKRVIWQLPFDTVEDARAAADFHNSELGWSRKQADAIVGSVCPEGVSVQQLDG